MREDPGSIPRSGRSLGEGNGNPLQYSCLKNPMNRGVLQATVHGVTKSWTRWATGTSVHFLEKEEFTQTRTYLCKGFLLVTRNWCHHEGIRGDARIGFIKSVPENIWRPVLPVFPKHRLPHSCSPTPTPTSSKNSSVLALRIPGMGEPGGLPSMGSHRVGHDWSDLAAAAATLMILMRYVWESLKRHVFQSAPGDSEEPLDWASTVSDNKKEGLEHKQMARTVEKTVRDGLMVWRRHWEASAPVRWERDVLRELVHSASGAREGTGDGLSCSKMTTKASGCRRYKNKRLKGRLEHTGEQPTGQEAE